jgi:sugar fermentation stimulation protein A
MRLDAATALRGRFLRRYKRFFADVELDGGDVVTAHCPNTGSLKGCLVEGAPVILRDSGNPARKLRYTWQAIRLEGTWVNVDTSLPNHVAREAVESGRIRPLAGHETVRAEVPYGDGSRIDLLLSGRGRPDCYVEVKSTTLTSGRTALFPDAVTARGLKHLGELEEVVRAGGRAVQLFLVARDDVGRFAPADAIDPAYGEGLRRAAAAGVEVLAYSTRVDLAGIRIARKLPVALGTPARASRS